MSDLKNLEKAFSFNKEDITPPETVIYGIAKQIEHFAHGLVKAEIKQYDGHTVSYIQKSGLGALSLALTGKTEVDIQNSLGKIGYSEHKFELFLSAPKLPQYKFRVLFFSYGISGYPVQLTIEHGTAAEIANTQNTEGVFDCKTKVELEEIACNIFNTTRMIAVIQELIDASIIAETENSVPSDKVAISGETIAEPMQNNTEQEA